MQNPIYIAIVVAASTGLWLLWDVALRSLFLDALRERVFGLRFALFELALAGELSFDSETYRSVEILLNGVLRFAHRFTFMTYVLSTIEQNKAKKQKDYEDVARLIALRISQTQPHVQEKLNEILSDLHHALTVYMALTSLLFLGIAAIYTLLHVLHIRRVETKSDITAVIESEAYRAEARDGSKSELALA